MCAVFFVSLDPSDGSVLFNFEFGLSENRNKGVDTYSNLFQTFVQHCISVYFCLSDSKKKKKGHV